MIKYKYSTPGENWVKRIDGDSITEFNRHQADRYPGWIAELEGWEASGNTIEPFETPAEMAEREAEEAEYEKVKYKDLRRAEYPLIGDQLDYIYHNGVEAWKTDIVKPVKDKYPKPE